MNEAETRSQFIYPALKAAGWGDVEGSRIREEYLISPGRIESHGKKGKPLWADYILEYRNTKLAVVEAKAWNEELTEGVAQAKNYADKLAIRFTYSTNGPRPDSGCTLPTANSEKPLVLPSLLLPSPEEKELFQNLALPSLGLLLGINPSLEEKAYSPQVQPD